MTEGVSTSTRLLTPGPGSDKTERVLTTALSPHVKGLLGRVQKSELE